MKESKETQRILFLKAVQKSDGIVRTKQHLLHHYLTKRYQNYSFCKDNTTIRLKIYIKKFQNGSCTLIQLKISVKINR